MSGEAGRAAGIRFERKVGVALRGDGYRTNRGAGSKGFADFVAVKPGQVLFVACKLTGVISAAEWDVLVEVASWVGAVPVLAVNGPAGRGIDYWRLTGRRVRRAPMGRQPAERFHTDVVAVDVRQEWVDGPESPKITELTPEPRQGHQTGAVRGSAATRAPGIANGALTVDP